MRSGRSLSSRFPPRFIAGTEIGAVRAAAMLLGLAGVAVTQPLLDLFGRNPEFFVAGKYDSSQIVWFSIVIAFAPWTVGCILAGVGWLIHPLLGRITYCAVMSGFGILFTLVLLDSLGVDVMWLVVTTVLAATGVLVWLVHNLAPLRSLLTYLAAGNMVFLALFLFASPTAQLVAGNEEPVSIGSVRVPGLDGPVVLAILDEFPVTTLMREDGSLNDERFPGFARLAEQSTWFRNASSLSNMTNRSVPSILTGTLSQQGELPTYHDYPRNYFTLFAGRYLMNRYEIVTDMCPPEACERGPQGSLRTALRDGGVVYGHRVLPRTMRDELPEIDHAWGGFGDAVGEAVAAPASPAPDSAVGSDGYGRWHSLDPFDRSALGQSRIFDEMTAAIGATPSVNLIHVALPHSPWGLTPWGSQLMRYPSGITSDPDDPAFPLANAQRFHLHSLQVGAADAAVGRLIDHLESVGAWDDALVVVMSDHGLSLLPPDMGRKNTENSREELLRVPLFIKAPHQTDGAIDDDVALTIDVLPSIVDLLDAEPDWKFDGHSLYDGSAGRSDPVVDRDVRAAFDVARRHAVSFPHGNDWVGLAAVGDHDDLVGKPVDQVRIGQPSDLRWSPDDADVFSSLPTGDGRVPYLLTGTVPGRSGDRPAELVVAVNGVFAGVVGAYQPEGDRWRFTGVMGPFFSDGSNDVTAYEVEGGSDGRVLHRVAAE